MLDIGKGTQFKMVSRIETITGQDPYSPYCFLGTTADNKFCYVNLKHGSLGRIIYPFGWVSDTTSNFWLPEWQRSGI
jgi:hypothetical protein